MSVIINVVDELLTGELLTQFPLTMQSSRVTVREIIQSRVTQEVENYNKARTGNFNGLIQPTKSEQMLNGFRMNPRNRINCPVQIEAALDAFERNGFLVLINARQVESLDEEVLVTPDTKVAFVKLVPLVGG
ncbi:MAG TPA: hypothetical protein VKM55_30000 [Candidatus Lokiarchaeia archaeon]|nr:hypothetical protein [Candidatus Lokiarchaeia archaeon]